MASERISKIDFLNTDMVRRIHHLHLKKNGDKLCLLPQKRVSEYLFPILALVSAGIALFFLIQTENFIVKLIPLTILLVAILFFLPIFWYVDSLEIQKGPFLEINISTQTMFLQRRNIHLKFQDVVEIQQIEGDMGGDSLCELDFLVRSENNEIVRHPVLLCSTHGCVIEKSKKISGILGVKLNIITNHWRSRPFAKLQVYNP